MTSSPASTPTTRKKLLNRIAGVRKQAETAKKAAKLAKAGFKAAKQKFKEARRTAKRHRKEIKALKAELAALVVKKKPARKPARPVVQRKRPLPAPVPVPLPETPSVIETASDNQTTAQ